MGYCEILSLARSISNSKNKKFNYEVIGLKPGEKSFEELVTANEAEPYVLTLYIILLILSIA